MAQRKYLIKNRLEPMKERAFQACYTASYKFQKFVCWGDAVQMIKDGRLQLQPRYYHNNIRDAGMSLWSTYKNPFGKAGIELLGNKHGAGGVQPDEDEASRLREQWKQKFTHATDFIMLAGEDTAIALLHNLEASVDEFVLSARAGNEAEHRKEAEWETWLKKQATEE